MLFVTTTSSGSTFQSLAISINYNVGFVVARPLTIRFPRFLTFHTFPRVKSSDNQYLWLAHEPRSSSKSLSVAVM